METFSALLVICAGNSPVTGEFPQKASDAELWYFLWSRINGWVNNREAVDLRRHHAHYDVIVMLRCNFVDSMIFKCLYGQTQTLQIVINIGVRKRIFVSTLSKILAEAEM